MSQDGRIADDAGLDAALAAPRFLLFKHSRRCPTSARAFRAYAAFVAQNPGVPTGWIDVVRDRSLSRRVVEVTGIWHESPQALWLRGGRVAWHASHFAIRAEALEAAVFHRG